MKLPAEATIYEVGPRDGLQNEQALVPTAVKAEFVTRLARAGLPVVESTSFVHPRLVPQMADAEAVMAGVLAEGFLPGGVSRADVALATGLDVEDGAWRATAFSGDRAEGVAAFNEKRRPDWPGK